LLRDPCRALEEWPPLFGDMLLASDDGYDGAYATVPAAR
jgi:hypothetical protein